MNKRFKDFLKLAFFLGLGIVLIALSVSNLTNKDIEEIKNAIQKANYSWILLSVTLGLLSHYIRAKRWLRLIQPMGYNPTIANSLFSVLIGYLANYAFPRLGEVTRPGIIYKYEKIPFAETFGTVIIERVIDSLLFVVVFFAAFLFGAELLSDYFKTTLLQGLFEKYGKWFSYWPILIPALLIVMYIIFRFKHVWNNSNSAFGKLIKGFADGIQSVFKLKKPASFLLESLMIWVLYYLMLHVCFFAFEETAVLPPTAALVAFAFGTLTIMITPGGIGAYPLAIQSILLLYSVNSNIGFALGWLAWLAQFVTILLFGLLSLVLLPVVNSKKQKPK